MAKKFGKFLMTAAALTAAAAGAYYYLQKKEELDEEIFDEDDDFDNFDDDLDDDEKDTERKYVDLDMSKAAEASSEESGEFKEGLDAAKAEATDKIVGEENNAKAAETQVEEFFDDEDDNDGSLDAM